MRHSRVSSLVLLLGPALLLFLVSFLFPLAYLVVYSFSRYDPFQLVVPIFTLENYRKILYDEYIREILLRTFRVSTLTTLTTLMLGYPLAYYMNFAKGLEKTALAIVVLSPLMTSHIILGYAWMVLIASHTGVLSRLLLSLGLLSRPLELMYTEAGIVVGLAHYTLVYMVLNLHAALETIDRAHLRAAAVLGASPLQAFLRITLPLSLPGIFSGCLLVFAISSSAFMIPFLLGGRQVPMLAIYAYDLNTLMLNWPLGAATGLILLLISVAAMITLSVAVARLRMRLGMQ